ncbi:CLP protease R subunit 4 [Perilla frutescens var. hirtella]|uniref:CLP protease R subunit 4 n=1 Tax=Perilla frutescens var. hirtella TaxID=608512 RepID=A0AAD4J570_PERFH|nr:CLP protease R subunit 4 [Perilla frutescens var. hirtella]
MSVLVWAKYDLRTLFDSGIYEAFTLPPNHNEDLGESFEYNYADVVLALKRGDLRILRHALEEHEDRYVKPPIFTQSVGNARGEAALLVASGAKGNQSALPSSTIMIKQPIARFQGQATDVVALSSVTSIIDGLRKLYVQKLKLLEVNYWFNDFVSRLPIP